MSLFYLNTLSQHFEEVSDYY